MIEVEGVGGGSTGGVPEGEKRRGQGAKWTRHFIHRLSVTDDLEPRRERTEDGCRYEEGSYNIFDPQK